jgi:hypothetical protein
MHTDANQACMWDDRLCRTVRLRKNGDSMVSLPSATTFTSSSAKSRQQQHPTNRLTESLVPTGQRCVVKQLWHVDLPPAPRSKCVTSFSRWHDVASLAAQLAKAHTHLTDDAVTPFILPLPTAALTQAEAPQHHRVPPLQDFRVCTGNTPHTTRMSALCMYSVGLCKFKTCVINPGGKLSEVSNLR